MTDLDPHDAAQLLGELARLRKAAGEPSYTTLVRQAAAQQPPVTFTGQRLSDWFGGRAVPADPAVVRFLVDYLQPRARRTSGYQQRPLSWWLELHRKAVRQRQAGAQKHRRITSPAPTGRRLGRPIDHCDPLVLEVHPAIRVPGAQTAADLLPGYVPRSHDSRLHAIADQVLDGGSRLVTLVGGSSTGKTRACWELTRYLEQRQPGQWWVWHPYDPTRPQAAVADLQQVGARTVMWLNEAQHYLMLTDPALGERLAAGLRALLQDADRAPVLVLATLWPQYWDKLTVRPSGDEPDPYAQARELLTGSAVPVADTFTPDQVAELVAAGADARLRYAAEHAEGGRVTQYLAGAPELQTRYRTADPAARALLQVAIDARRLGYPLAIPHAILKQAAPGYLDDHDWDHVGKNWLERALADTARPCKGARGPLTRIRSRPGQHTPDGGPYYRLADYLEQIGRRERASVYPPESLWKAFAATVTDPDLLSQLATQAAGRGRYQHAIWLYTRAANYGSIGALSALGRLREQVGDDAGALALYQQAAGHGNIEVVRDLARLRENAGDAAGATALAMQAANHGDTGALLYLVGMRTRAGDAAGIETLRQQLEVMYRPAVDRDDTDAPLRRVETQQEVEAADDADALAEQFDGWGDGARQADLGQLREDAGDIAGAEALYQESVDRGYTEALSDLAELREVEGDSAGAERIWRFGLTGSAGIATRLDFDPQIWDMPD